MYMYTHFTSRLSSILRNTKKALWSSDYYVYGVSSACEELTISFSKLTSSRRRGGKTPWPVSRLNSSPS